MCAGSQPVVVACLNTVAWYRRNHQVESVRCRRAMRRGIGQGIDNLHLLDDRAGPSVRDDERQRVVVLRTHVNEMNVQPIDFGDETAAGRSTSLRTRASHTPLPNSARVLNRLELHTLRFIPNRFPLRPLCRLYAPAQFGKFRFRNIHTKLTNSGLVTAHLLSNVAIASDLSAKPSR